MRKTKEKLGSKVKRYLLNFEDDEKRIQESKQKTQEALERLRTKGKARS